MSDEMSHPVTKGELRDVLADYPTKADLRDVLADYPTTERLRAELTALGVDLRGELPSKVYVDDMARTFIDALVRLEARTDAKFDKMSGDLMRHMNSLIDAV